MTAVYLAGAINGRSDSEATEWRTHCKRNIKHVCIDPMVRDYRGRELDLGIAEEVVSQDKADIRNCPIILVYYDKPSVGTSMEVLYAWDKAEHIIIVDKSGKPLSPWLIYHCDIVFGSLDDAIAYINGLH